ncbi:MAG: amino acid adenylation domain-containing protein [Betaproteobacteria bacterium]|nr:amino acid adenylation domain-containing protein [Betaproteobacteria bacterium]
MNATGSAAATLSAVDYDPFADTALSRVVPSTEAQREIWLACQLGTEASLAYNESISLRLRGPLDQTALRSALQALVDRHDALRATLGAEGQDLYIAEALELHVPVHDLTALNPEQREASLRQHIRAEVDTPFDLLRGPLLRAQIALLAEDDAVLMITAHHIVCDGWSFGVLVGELARLYAQGIEKSVLLAQPSSFADFALAQAARIGTAEHAADEAYWLGQYASIPPALDLPLDRARPPQRSFASQRIDHVIPADLIEQIRQLGACQGTSLFSTLLAAFAALLQRLTGSDEVVVGVPAAGQTLPGFDLTVGHGVNLLPLRLAVNLAAPLPQALPGVQSIVLDAFEHQHYTFGTLLKKLVVERDPSRVPLAPVMFNLDQPLQVDGFPNLQVQVTSVPRHYENFELFINGMPEAGGLRLECQYAASLFDASTIQRWLTCFEALLRHAYAQQGTPVGQLDIVSAADRARLAVYNATFELRPDGALVHRLLYEAHAHKQDAPALQAGDISLTHRALWARAHHIAHALRKRGVAHGTRVGLCLPRNVDMLAAVLGALVSGAAYVPLDPSFPAARLADMAADARLTLLVSHSTVAGALPWPRSQSLWLDTDAALIDAQPDTPPEPDADLDARPESTAYLIYTSGSTGRPKGVMVPHRAVVNFLMAVAKRPGLHENDKLLAVTTLSFDIAVLELLLPLLVGGCVVLASREEAADGFALSEMVDQHDITALQATPSTWRLLFDAGWRGKAGFKALVGGEALPMDLAQQLLAVCGEVWNMYGPTETTVWSTCWKVEDGRQDISIGTPLANTQIWILDTQGQPCPIGIPGEIHIGGTGVALGYWQRPDLTAERFIPDLLSNAPGALLYRTGDRGRWRDDGLLEHLGRLDFQVKLRGFRIELGDIESHVGTHPAVAQALALVREDTSGDARLVVYVVPREGNAVPSTAALREYLQSRLPAYMLPQNVVALDAMPLLPNGKVDRKSLPAPLPDRRTSGAQSARLAPHTPMQSLVAAAMETVLQLPGLAVDDDFFALGGHSLLAAQLAARLREQTGFDILMRTVFAEPSIRKLAAWLDAHATNGLAKATTVPSRADQSLAPASLQQGRIWFLEQLDPGLPTFNTPSAHRLRGSLNVTALERAINAMVARQASLRTFITDDDGVPIQVVLPELHVSLGVVEDLSTLLPAEREPELMRRLQRRSAEVFDLTEPPLFKLGLYRLAEDDHVLFFMPHHIIWDGWSFDLVYDEMAALYPAFASERAPNLPPLRVSYGDYATWQQDWLRTPDLQRQLSYWRDILTPLPTPLNLPGDHARPARMSGAGDTHWLRQDDDWFAALHRFGQRHDATPYMVLLAGFASLLWCESGQTDMVIGTPVRGRPAVDLEPVMGFFVNALPLRLRVDPAQSFLVLLQQVRSVALDAFGAPDAPLEQMLHFAGVPRSESHSPIYQAFFSYQDARRRNHAWGNLKQENLRVYPPAAAEDVRLWFMVEPDGVLGGLTYNTDVFDAPRVARWVQTYLSLLAGAMTSPDAPLRTLAQPAAPQSRAAATTTQPATLPVTATPEPIASSPTEATLSQVWCELLGLDNVDRLDNFFDLGGHSLLVMQAIARMRNLTGKALSPRAYVLETLAQIATRYDSLPNVAPTRPGLIRRLFGGGVDKNV